MPVESVEERGLLDMELAAATVQGRGDVESPSDAYTGRSSAYGYLARGLILQLVSYEWHNKASKQGGHPLVDVLESFRKEGLYSHWLRTFTRLDYFPAQLEQYASTIRRACNVNTPTTDLLSDVPVGAISLYLDGLICDANTLKWQLGAGGDVKTSFSRGCSRAQAGSVGQPASGLSACAALLVGKVEGVYGVVQLTSWKRSGVE